MIKKIFFAGAIIMAFSFQKNSEINETLKKVKEKYDKVNDYSATGKLRTNVIFIKAPVATVKVYYKKPDKLRIKNEKGISLIPKGTVNINLNNVLGLTDFEIFDGGKEKVSGAIYIERTTENPLYGAFAVIVGLLVWINIVSRVLLLCAAWTVTAPYDSDVPPSGTADAETAREAGIPAEFADNDPDDPPTIQDDGAPSPLAAAVQGEVPSQDVPDGRGGDRTPDRQRAASPAAGSSSAGVGTGPGTARTGHAGGPAAVEPRAQVLVRQAGQFTAGALGMVVMAVLLHLGRTAKDLLRR